MVFCHIFQFRIHPLLLLSTVLIIFDLLHLYLKMTMIHQQWNNLKEEFQEFGAALAESKVTYLDFEGSNIVKGFDLFENINPVINGLRSSSNAQLWAAECWIPKAWHGNQPTASSLLPLSNFLCHPLLQVKLSIENKVQLAVVASTIMHHHAGPKQLHVKLPLDAEVLRQLSLILRHAQQGLNEISIGGRIDSTGFDEFVPLV